MKHADYLITMNAGGRIRQIPWDSRSSMALDYSKSLFIEKNENEIFINEIVKTKQKKHSLRLISISEEQIQELETIPLPGKRKSRIESIEVKRLEHLNAAWNPSADSKISFENGGTIFVAFHGIKGMLIDYKKYHSTYLAREQRKSVFDISRSDSGTLIKAHRDGVVFKHGEKTLPIGRGSATFIADSEILSGDIVCGTQWWRLREIPASTELPEIFPDEVIEDEKEFFKRTSKIASLVFSALVVTVLLFGKVGPEMKPVAQVTLKTPKIIPKPPVEIAKPKPKEEPKKLAEKPKPKPEPKKVAEKKPKPPKKLHAEKKPPIIPKKIAKKNTRPAIQSTRVLAKSPPKKNGPMATARVVRHLKSSPAAAQAQAARVQTTTKKAISNALSFLGGPSPNLSTNLARTYDGPGVQRGKAMGTAPYVYKGKLPGGSELGAIDGKPDAPIVTRGSRDVAGVNLYNGQRSTISGGKSFNGVQAKVSLDALYSAKGTGTWNGKKFSMRGPGSLEDAALEAALARKLAQFQYCYEKALLADPALGGMINLKWRILDSGEAPSPQVHVVSSQMNSNKLESCITGIIASIRFPRPKGGHVDVNYPFNFSSTTL